MSDRAKRPRGTKNLLFFFFFFFCTRLSISTILLGLVGFAHGVPYDPSENFVNPCPLTDEPPLDALKLWSSPSSWSDGAVPGVGGKAGANATIPCGAFILFDMPSVELDLLHVKGYLKFLDASDLPEIYLKANYILVEGYLTIGTETDQFKNRVTIELTPNIAANRAVLKFSDNFPADPDHPRKLGHKAFVVVGGQVNLHGLPGERDMALWCKLIKTVKSDQNVINLDADVTWPVGSDIVIANTHVYQDITRIKTRNEVARIVKVTPTSRGSQLTLDRVLAYNHDGDPSAVPDGYGGYFDHRAEVGLLSRNIVIRGTNETAPYALEGGHFMIYQTQIPQYIEGTSFVNMGQQRILGRYPIHFHFNGAQENATKGTYCKGNSIVDGNQRCVVVHGTSGVLVENNVAYNNFGHCFITEDGGETNNRFINNLGIIAKPLYGSLATDGGSRVTSDGRPSMFWMSNPTNDLINNTAVGFANSGIWYELQINVLQPSLSVPRFKNLKPQWSPLGIVSGNTVHGCMAGLLTYERGMHPQGTPLLMTGFNLYKNNRGVDARHVENLILKDSFIAFSTIAVHLGGSQNCQVVNTTILVGRTDAKTATTSTFAPPYTTYSTNRKLNLRNHMKGAYDTVTPKSYFGVALQMNLGGESGRIPNSIVSTRFSSYPYACTSCAAIGLVSYCFAGFWNSATFVEDLKFTQGTNAIWLQNTAESECDLDFLSKEIMPFYNLWDKDGSIVGSPGYVVAINPRLLPVTSTRCTLRGDLNAYTCPSTCYRTLVITYTEPRKLYNGQTNAKGFSWISMTREADGSVVELNGTFSKSKKVRTARLNVLSGMAYTLDIEVPDGYPRLVPERVEIRFGDGTGCNVGLTVHVPTRVPNYRWIASATPSFVLKLCPGQTDDGSTLTQYSFVCIDDSSVLQLEFGGSSSGRASLVRQNGSSDCSESACALVTESSDNWLMDLSGDELRPDFYQNEYDDGAWQKFPLANNPNNLDKILPRADPAVTFYFRKNIFLRDAHCYAGIFGEMFICDGAILYVNGKKIFGNNMPDKIINNKTPAVKKRYQWAEISLANITDFGPILVDGHNSISVETHTARGSYRMALDLILNVERIPDVACTGKNQMPELCDGLDNNSNGLVDEDDDGNPLTRPCQSCTDDKVQICENGIWLPCVC